MYFCHLCMVIFAKTKIETKDAFIYDACCVYGERKERTRRSCRDRRERFNRCKLVVEKEQVLKTKKNPAIACKEQKAHAFFMRP